VSDSPVGRGRARSRTIEDVAALAGVSVATVSRALRGLPNVAPTTRARVQDAADRLRYRPDPNASRLAAGRSNAVGIAMPYMGQWYFAQVLAGVEAVLASAGYDLLVYSAATPDDRRRFLSDALPVVKRVDGVVLVDLTLPDGEVESWSRSGIRLVSVGQRVDPFPSVSLDNVAVARLAVEHLVALGHRSIGLIGAHAPEADDDPFRFTVPQARHQGYLQALAAAGIDPRPEHQVPAPFDVGSGRAAMGALLDGPHPPTAVLATSDEMAIGALGGLRDRGLSAPGDVSVIGIDDHDLAEPIGLTTIRQPVVEIGGWAAELLLAELRTGTIEPEHVAVPFELVVRGTTAPPPA
jgi:LacI family transcriptional regulator, repressor for deo operon, udp, cdd, tsx, nupC, and nupG